jgi:hypothetical protein
MLQQEAQGKLNAIVRNMEVGGFWFERQEKLCRNCEDVLPPRALNYAEAAHGRRQDSPSAESTESFSLFPSLPLHISLSSLSISLFLTLSTLSLSQSVSLSLPFSLSLSLFLSLSLSLFEALFRLICFFLSTQSNLGKSVRESGSLVLLFGR